MEFIVLLGTPLLGALTLGVSEGGVGHRKPMWAFRWSRFSPHVRSRRRVVAHGNLLVAHEQFFIDAFNVFLVTLTAFVGLTTSVVLAPLHAHRG